MQRCYVSLWAAPGAIERSTSTDRTDEPCAKTFYPGGCGGRRGTPSMKEELRILSQSSIVVRYRPQNGSVLGASGRCNVDAPRPMSTDRSSTCEGPADRTPQDTPCPRRATHLPGHISVDVCAPSLSRGDVSDLVSLLRVEPTIAEMRSMSGWARAWASRRIKSGYRTGTSACRIEGDPRGRESLSVG